MELFSPVHRNKIIKFEIIILHCIWKSANMSSIPPCREYADFERYLRDSRKADDNVILLLNKTDGTPSQCSQLWGKLEQIHDERSNAIKSCIRELEGIYIFHIYF